MNSLMQSWKHIYGKSFSGLYRTEYGLLGSSGEEVIDARSAVARYLDHHSALVLLSLSTSKPSAAITDTEPSTAVQSVTCLPAPACKLG